MKKRILLVLLSALVAPLASCDSGNPFADKDYDGIYDLYDSDSNNNKSVFNLRDNSFGVDSNDIVIPVDYRNFIFDEKPTYNKDLAQMCAVISNYSYAENVPNWSIGEPNRFVSEESLINPALVQFGFVDLEHVTLEPGEKDPYDIVSLYLGNHIFEYENNDYQVVVVSIDGYPVQEMWYSNLDIGYDGIGYYEASGEHPEWLNKKHHKGYDITANRALPRIKAYLDSVKEDDAKEQIVLVTGHSRGGAVSNLVGKLLKDNNIKSVVYAFNGPRTTTESDESVLRSYTNIFNVDSVNDFVSRFPFRNMGFGSYGNMLSYDLVENNEYYKSIFNHDFIGNTEENLKAIDDLAKNLFGTREAMFNYLEKDPNIDEYVLCKDLSSANELKAQMDEEMKTCGITNLAKAQVVENTDEETKDTYQYVVEYYTKPAAFMAFAAECLVTAMTSEEIVSDLLDLADAGTRYISRYVSITIDTAKVELNVSAFSMPHNQKTCVAGAYVAK